MGYTPSGSGGDGLRSGGRAPARLTLGQLPSSGAGAPAGVPLRRLLPQRPCAWPGALPSALPASPLAPPTEPLRPRDLSFRSDSYKLTHPGPNPPLSLFLVTNSVFFARRPGASDSPQKGNTLVVFSQTPGALGGEAVLTPRPPSPDLVL